MQAKRLNLLKYNSSFDIKIGSDFKLASLFHGHFPHLIHYILYMEDTVLQNPFSFHLAGFLILFKIDKTIWPKMKNPRGEIYEQNIQLDRSKVDER
jgi:hypothetical protein